LIRKLFDKLAPEVVVNFVSFFRRGILGA